MKHIGIITKREYLNKVRNKSFIIMTFVSPLIVVIFGTLIGYLTTINSTSNVKKIGILDESGFFSNNFKDSETIKYYFLEKTTLSEAKLNVLTENSYGLLHIPSKTTPKWKENIEFFSEETPNITLLNQLSNTLEDALFELNLTDKGMNKNEIDNARESIHISLSNFSGEKSSELSSIIKIAIGGIAGYLIFMFIIIYGNMIMRSVIEEKSNRIVEIIISSVKPFELMLGKIFGTSLAGLTQFLIWMIFGGLLMTITTNFLGISPSSTNEIVMTKSGMDRITSEILVAFFQFPFMEMFGAFLLYFIGGYLLYSSIYATIGAMVDNETDTQQFLMPVLIPLILAVYIGFFSVIEEPHGTVSVVFSYIPLTSPVVMLMRVPFGVSWWELLISVVILYATFFLFIGIAAKIYRIGILMYGKKPTYKEILKWLKY
ncbi:ABC transporter permease [Capnocytophaga canis]|uniref:ABC transporter permease n=1 Tax=Capnocytophaga canis TaxID=1848903 RepID=UPI001561BB1D|nr:ABC transporter permease [Capnocytophaga canis]